MLLLNIPISDTLIVYFQNMPEIILPERKPKKKRKKKKKKNVVEQEEEEGSEEDIPSSGPEYSQHAVEAGAIGLHSVSVLETGALGFPPISAESGQVESSTQDTQAATYVEMAPEESGPMQSFEESEMAPNNGGFRGRGRGPYMGRWRGRRGYRRGGAPPFHGPPGPFGPPHGPPPPPHFPQGQYDPSFSYDYSQYYGQGGPPPPYSGSPMMSHQGPGPSYMPSDSSSWDQNAWGYQNDQMTVSYSQLVNPVLHNSFPPTISTEPPILPMGNQPETPQVMAPSQQLSSIPIPPPPLDPPPPLSIPLPQPQTQPSAFDIPLPPSDIPMPPSSPPVPEDQIPQNKPVSSVDISLPKKKTLVDMDVPALSPAEPEEVRNVSECVMPSGEKSLVVETTPMVGMSPTAELLETEAKEEICDIQQSDHTVTDAKPETSEANMLDQGESKDKDGECKEQESDKNDDNQDKETPEIKVPVKTTAQMLLEKIAMKKKTSEMTETGEVTEPVAEGTKSKMFVKSGSKFLLKQLKQDAGKIQFSVKLGATGPKKGNALQKPDKPEVEDLSKHKGGARELYKPSDKDKEELLLETMTPKQRDSYLRYQEQKEREAKREERRKQHEMEREKQKKEEKDSSKKNQRKSVSVEKEMETSDIQKIFSSPRTDTISEQIGNVTKVDRKSEERSQAKSGSEEKEIGLQQSSDSKHIISDVTLPETLSGTENAESHQLIKHLDILPQKINSFSHDMGSDVSSPTSSKIHSVKVITVDKSKDTEKAHTERKKKSRWSETKVEMSTASDVTVLPTEVPTAVPMVTDMEVYSPDHPTESPKLSTTAGNNNSQVFQKKYSD